MALPGSLVPLYFQLGTEHAPAAHTVVGVADFLSLTSVATVVAVAPTSASGAEAVTEGASPEQVADQSHLLVQN